MNENEKAKECYEFLKNYCKEENCTTNCPFAYQDYDTHCILGGQIPMYPSEWDAEKRRCAK